MLPCVRRLNRTAAAGQRANHPFSASRARCLCHRRAALPLAEQESRRWTVTAAAGRERPGLRGAWSRVAAAAALASFLLISPTPVPCSAPAWAYPVGNVKGRSQEAVDYIRAAGHFVRAYDGHISVQRSTGDWMDVRVDPENPGTVLLRSGQGHVFFLQYEFKQIDMSDDDMVRDMFEDRLWEDNLERMGYVNEAGKLIDYISQDDFYDWWRWSSGTVEELEKATAK